MPAIEISIRPDHVSPEQWAEAFSFFEADPEFGAKEIVAEIDFEIDGDPECYEITALRWCGKPLPGAIARRIEDLIFAQHGDWLENHVADLTGYVWTGNNPYEGEWRPER